MTKPPAEMSADDLLSFYEFYCRYEPRNTAMQDIRSELLRRIEPKPLSIPTPIESMTVDELWKEFCRLYGDQSPELTHVRYLIVEEIKSRPTAKGNTK